MSNASNVHPLPAGEQVDLASAIDDAIRSECYRKVDKRLSLKLARALLDNSSEADIFYAQRLIHVLKYRIDLRAEVATRHL